MHEIERHFLTNACRTLEVPQVVRDMYDRVRKCYNRGKQGYLDPQVLALIIVLSGWDEKVQEEIAKAREKAAEEQKERDRINPGDPVVVLDPDSGEEKPGVFHSERKDRKYNIAFQGDEKKYRVVERRHVLKNV